MVRLSDGLKVRRFEGAKVRRFDVLTVRWSEGAKVDRFEGSREYYIRLTRKYLILHYRAKTYLLT